MILLPCAKLKSFGLLELIFPVAASNLSSFVFH